MHDWQKPATLMDQPLFFDRDLSWLQFNERVLQEAKDPSVPLYERLKFLAIYSSNLDEFFRVRVSSLRSLRKMKDAAQQLNLKPKKTLREIKRIVNLQQEEFGRIFTDEILPQLRENKIHLLKDDELNDEQKEFASEFFKTEIKRYLVPFVILEESVDVFLENRKLYLVVQFDPDGENLGLIGIPHELSRFVSLPADADKHCITYVDDILRLNLSEVFPGHTIYGTYAIKMSRDAELYLGDEFSGDLIARLEERVKERSKGLPMRFLYDKEMPETVLKKLRKTFNISKYDIIPGARYHNFNDFMGFPNPTGNPKLHDKPLPPLEHHRLPEKGSILEAIRQRDHLLHFPYQRYDYVPRLIREAAGDPDVESISITLYRVASNSVVTEALLEALSKGKQVFAFIEAKARFDEESNLFWGRKLEQAGASVKYSFPGIKVHTKLLLLQTTADSKTRSVAYLGTGNFNEKTARIYADHALLTAKNKLTVEVSRVFEMLKGTVIAPQCKKLFVSPFTTRIRFEERIDQEIENAKNGIDAWMILKMNSLQDKQMIQKLYQASAAGVQIQIIVRGFCCLIPGIPGVSDNIRVTSIVDRFLEHARVYIFANGGNNKVYLASADWMTRNLDRRIEVVFPISDKALQAELRSIIDLQLSDNTKARIIDQQQTNQRAVAGGSEEAIRAQTATYQMLNENLSMKALPDTDVQAMQQGEAAARQA